MSRTLIALQEFLRFCAIRTGHSNCTRIRPVEKWNRTLFLLYEILLDETTVDFQIIISATTSRLEI
jgi:hypothetical protein